MPPKPRGRGRGRGGTARGASSTAAASASASASASAAASQQPAPEAEMDASPTPVTAVSTPSEPPSGAATPASTSAATPTAPTALQKIKPKAVRRSQAERARINEEIARKEAIRDGIEAKQNRFSNRGARGGRGRGNFLMNRTFRSTAAAGPLSSGTFSSNGERAVGAGGYAVASGSRALVSNVKGEDDMYGGIPTNVKGRINADTLYDYSKPYSYEPGSDKRAPILPMGIRRLAHKAEGANKTPEDDTKDEEDNSDDEGLFVNDGEDVGKSEEGDAEAGTSSNNLSIKKEGGDGMDIDLSQIPHGGDGSTAPKPLPAEKKKGPGGAKSRAAAAQRTPKSIEEDIHARELAQMVALLNLSKQPLENQDASEARPRTMLDGHMFHFQFPPVLPALEAEDDGNDNDDESENGDDDVVMTGQSSSSAVTNTKPAKTEGGEDEDDDDENENYDFDESGYVGKLIVRRSGKVELDWGGHRMEVGMGIEKSFFTSAVLLDIDEEKPVDASGNTSKAASGVAYSMGRVQGTFTVSSFPEPVQEWIVDPRELEVGAKQ